MRLIKTLAFAFVTLATTITARADPIVVTDGGLIFDIEGDWFDLRGAGFALSRPAVFGEHLSVDFANFCFPCRSGDLLDLSFTTSTEQPFGAGSAIVMGTTFPEVFYRLELTAHVTPLTFPDTDASRVEILQRFRFSAVIRAFNDPAFGELAFAAVLRGGGHTRTNYFVHDESGVFFPEEGQLAYVFDEAQPVPEPMSVLLLGSGLTALGVRRWRAHRHSRAMCNVCVTASLNDGNKQT